MSADRAFRLIVSYQPDKQSFTARVPELDLETSAATRQDAVQEAEDAIEQRIAEASEKKLTLPDPIDARESGGTITVKLGSTLHRDLLFHAKASGLSAEELAGQLLASMVTALDGGRLAKRRLGTLDSHDEHGSEAQRGTAGRGGEGRAPDERNRGGGNRGPRRREGYHADLDDKANFLEYLRGLEKGGGSQGGGRGRR